jgi:transcriptional regulator with XRE-family HTH domain
MENIGRRIKEERERRLLDQGSLAKLAGISRTSLNGIETGRTKQPRMGILRKIAEALGIDGTELTRPSDQ